jgi:2-polyprenyl-3-methyl-5-hydroxy-6-metoxy-1,4-benzoquinol methylase
MSISNKASRLIRAEPCPRCYLCQAPGDLLYEGMRDRLFDASGEWNLRRCPARTCGLLWLDPMPMEEDIAEAYETYYTHQPTSAASAAPSILSLRRAVSAIKRAYVDLEFNAAPSLLRRVLAAPIYLMPWYQVELEFPLRILSDPQKGRMLDVGCGSGALVHLAARMGWEAEGIDVDPKAIACAKRSLLTVRLGSLLDQRFPNAAFDLLVSNHSIEHVHDPLSLLKECRRILSPKGRLVISTPNATSILHARFLADWFALDPPRHLHIFTPHSLRNLALAAGFKDAVVRTTARGAATTAIYSRSIRASGHVTAESQRSSLYLYGILHGLNQARLTMSDAYAFAGEDLMLDTNVRAPRSPTRHVLPRHYSTHAHP